MNDDGKCTICGLFEFQHQGGYDRHVFTTKPREPKPKWSPSPELLRMMAIATASVGLLLAGLALITIYADWLVAVGVLLALWGNNITVERKK